MTDIGGAWIAGEVLHKTEKALLIRIPSEGDLEEWFPISQILYGEEDPEVGFVGEWEFPRWLLDDKGLEGDE